MKYVMMFTYMALIIAAFYYAFCDKYDRACLDLLIAYGIRWQIQDEYGK